MCQVPGIVCPVTRKVGKWGIPEKSSQNAVQKCLFQVASAHYVANFWHVRLKKWGYWRRLLTTVHTPPESVKRVKSSAQILVKSFFWRLNAPNALGGSSSHERTPLLNACQKWSPLMTGVTSKCICGVQPPEKWLNQNLFATFYSFYTFRSGVRLHSLSSMYEHGQLNTGDSEMPA